MLNKSKALRTSEKNMNSKNLELNCRRANRPQQYNSRRVAQDSQVTYLIEN